MEKVATKTQQSKARASPLRPHLPCNVKISPPPPQKLRIVGEKAGPLVPPTVGGFSLLKGSLSDLRSTTMTALAVADETKDRSQAVGSTKCKIQAGNASEDDGNCPQEISNGGCSAFSGNVPPTLLLETCCKKRAISASSPSPLPSSPKKIRATSRSPQAAVKCYPHASREACSRINFHPRFSQGEEEESSTAGPKPQVEKRSQPNALVDTSRTPVLLPEVPESPDSPEAPEPNAPQRQEAPDSTEGSGAPKAPETPDSPEGTEGSGVPEAPEVMTGTAIEKAAPLTTPENRADFAGSSLPSATLTPPSQSKTPVPDEKSWVAGEVSAAPCASSSPFTPPTTAIDETGIMPTATVETSSLTTAHSSSPSQKKENIVTTRADITSTVSTSIPPVLPCKTNESEGENGVAHSDADAAEASIASPVNASPLAPEQEEASSIRSGGAADVSSPSTVSQAPSRDAIAFAVMSSSGGRAIAVADTLPSSTESLSHAQNSVRNNESSLDTANKAETTLASASAAAKYNSTTSMDTSSHPLNAPSPSPFTRVFPTDSNKRARVKESKKTSSGNNKKKKFKTSEEARRQRAQTRPSRSKAAVAERERARVLAKAREDAFQREVFDEQPMTERDADLIRRAYLLGASKVIAGKNLAEINRNVAAKSSKPLTRCSGDVGECTTRGLCPDLSPGVRLEWDFYEPSMFVALNEAADISSLDDLFDTEGTDLQIDEITLPDLTTRGDDGHRHVDASSIVSV